MPCPYNLMFFQIWELKCKPDSYCTNVDMVYTMLAHTPHRPCMHCALACSCLHMCLRAAGLADSGIIFGSTAAPLWRASLKSAGSLRLPLSVRESGQARPSRLADCSGAQLTGVVACSRPSSKNTVLHTDARLLTGSGVLHFHWCSASESRSSHPLCENRHSNQAFSHIFSCMLSQWVFRAAKM